MALLNIQDPPRHEPFNLFVLGFRPFFIAAGLFAVASLVLWSLVYGGGLELTLHNLSPSDWHAHEMIYGYTMAVIAGFLLTAIRNWTDVQTWQHRPLVMLWALWLLARLSWSFGTAFIFLAAFADLLFNLLLFIATLSPILQVRQWKQIGIVSKVLLMGLFNSLFYLGLLGVLDMGVYWGVYGGLFVVLALILTMGRRVLPFFIEKGVNYPVQLKNARWLDISSLLLFVGFTLSELFILNPTLSGWLASLLFIVLLWRLINWYTHGLWKTPMLWGLYVAFLFITLGILMFALLPHYALFSRTLAIHALAFGGIGLVTLAMMARVTLGHSGRDIRQPARATAFALGCITLGAIIRILPTALWPELYRSWILASQCLWILGFALFCQGYIPMLVQARIDGREG